MTLPEAIRTIVDSTNLSREQMRAVMLQVMTGRATMAQVGALLVAMRMKGETVDEITGAAEIMRELVTPVLVDQRHLVDLVGTGGDAANLFNVSTAATFVASAAGARVAKHGNRSVSSSSGSSDVLEHLGCRLDLTPEQIARCIDEVGVGFMFAPAHHKAMKHAITPRRELALRTLFNILGPLTNPAFVKRQVLGVYSAELCKPLIEVLNKLGSECALVLHSEDGLDEISIVAPTNGWFLRSGKMEPIVINPADFGHAHANLEGLQVENPAASARLIGLALGGDRGAKIAKARSMIALNAGSAIFVSGVASSLSEGVALAEEMVTSGLAGKHFRKFISFTQSFPPSAEAEDVK